MSPSTVKKAFQLPGGGRFASFGLRAASKPAPSSRREIEDALARCVSEDSTASKRQLRVSRDRLAWIAMGCLLLSVASVLLEWGTGTPGGWETRLLGPVRLWHLGIGLDLALLLATRLPTVSAEALLKASLPYELLRAACLAWLPSPPASLSWTLPFLVAMRLALAEPQMPWLRSLAVASLHPLLLGAAAGLYPGATRALLQLLPPSVLHGGLGLLLARLAWSISHGEEPSGGRHAGSYNLIARLGKGGMGEVWQAEHRYLLRPAAIKLIPQNTEDSQLEREKALHRFRREAQVTASLSSPHTVQVYDYGLTESGLYYYVMEHLAGLDLQKLIELEGPISPGRAVYLVRQVTDSLGEAHEAGLVHRDIKPSNLFMVRRGEQADFVKVLDFGLVGVGAPLQEGGYKGQITREGMMTGTPAYMSPEMVQGTKLDGRADIYALGCVLYFLVSGKLVFPGYKPMAMAMAHAQQPPPRVSAAAKQAIPEDLEQVILSCLAKNPEERPQTARQLRRLLEQLECARDWNEVQAQAWWDQHQVRNASQDMRAILEKSELPIEPAS